MGIYKELFTEIYFCAKIQLVIALCYSKLFVLCIFQYKYLVVYLVHRTKNIAGNCLKERRFL